jgi:hypothetical protein
MRSFYRPHRRVVITRWLEREFRKRLSVSHLYLNEIETQAKHSGFANGRLALMPIISDPGTSCDRGRVMSLVLYKCAASKSK